MSQKKKGPEPVTAGQALKPKSNVRRNISKLSPRMQRLLKALLHQPQSSRELVDAIPANNPPAYIEILRKRHGFTVPLEHIRFTTIDGKASQYGVYALTSDDKRRAAELLQG